MPVDARGFQLVGDASQAAGNLGSFVSQKINERLQQRALGGDNAALARLSSRDPRAASQIGSILQGEEQKLDVTRQREQAIIPRIAQGYKAATDKTGFLQQTSNVLRSQGFDRLADDVEDDIQRYATDPTSVDLEYEAGLAMFTDPARAKQLTAAMRERQGHLDALKGAMDESGKLKPRDQLTPAQESAAIALKILTGKGTLGQAERIVGDPELAEDITEFEAEKAGAKEEAKLNVQMSLVPNLRAEIKRAEKEAADKGEALSDLKRAEVALPDLRLVVGQLKELAPIATSTIGGKFFDQAVKQTGFGSTKGADARAKFIAIVDNQILPLLKQTFGAAFTLKEAESLKATLGDPDASPDEKVQQLNAFIDAKERDLLAKRRAIGGGGQDSGRGDSTQQRMIDDEISQLERELGL